MPDFLLPQMVEALIEILRPMLARRRKDRGDSQRQAKADDLPQHIRMRVRSLEARVVVELGIGRATVRPPVGLQPLTEPARAQGGTDPRASDRAPQGPGGQHVQPGTGFQREVFDDIKGVQFRRACRHVGQIPARRRGGAAHAPHGIQRPMRFEHTPDGAQARSSAFGSFGEQSIEDGLCANESQVALTEFPAQRQNAALQADFGLPSLLAGGACD